MSQRLVVFWDWNGTIVNDASTFVFIMNSFLKEKGLPLINVASYRCHFEFPLINYYKSLGFRFNSESFDSLGKRFISKYKNHQFDASLYKNMEFVLSFVRQQVDVQCVVSAQENSLLNSSVLHYGLDCYFDDFLGVNNLFAENKELLVSCLYQKYNLSKNDKIIVVGDTAYDYRLSTLISSDCVLVSYGHTNKKRLLCCDCDVVNSVLELYFYLKNYCLD